MLPRRIGALLGSPSDREDPEDLLRRATSVLGAHQKEPERPLSRKQRWPKLMLGRLRIRAA